MSTIIGTRKTELLIDGVDVTEEVSSVVLAVADTDSDFVSFADALAGGAKDWTLKITLRQDTDTSSLWYVMWGSAGDDVSYEFWPNGGSPTPGTSSPQFSGDVTVSYPDGDVLGGEANESPKMVQTIELEWKCTDKPTLTTT